MSWHSADYAAFLGQVGSFLAAHPAVTGAIAGFAVGFVVGFII